MRCTRLDSYEEYTPCIHIEIIRACVIFLAFIAKLIHVVIINKPRNLFQIHPSRQLCLLPLLIVKMQIRRIRRRVKNQAEKKQDFLAFFFPKFTRE